MLIVVGSDNKIKVDAVRAAFKASYRCRFSLERLKAKSGVVRNPMDDVTCIVGARNRARYALDSNDAADLAVGIESGLSHIKCGNGKFMWFESTWVIVLDREEKEGIGSSGRIWVPDDIVAEIRHDDSGLGAVMDARVGREGTNRAEGYCGIATNGALSRLEATCGAVIFALGPFLNTDLFSRK
ncbi:MAG: inosine/xanthosine triphosphatase [bacterium]|nr:inosine/xanthosine triphosphatase [bacterium]